MYSYPLFEKTIGKVLYEGIQISKSAYETAKVLEYMINSNGLKNDRPQKGIYNLCPAETPVKFKKTGENFRKPVGGGKR